jgi:hypothetical protein
MTTERSGMSLDDKVAEFVGAVACNGSLSSWAVDGICELFREHLSRDAVVVIPDAMMVNLGEGTVMGEYSSNGDIVTGWNAYRKAMLAQRDGGNHGT